MTKTLRRKITQEWDFATYQQTFLRFQDQANIPWPTFLEGPYILYPKYGVMKSYVEDDV